VDSISLPEKASLIVKMKKRETEFDSRYSRRVRLEGMMDWININRK
jgi:hypothetical protein